jgi:hypothetical protein
MTLLETLRGLRFSAETQPHNKKRFQRRNRDLLTQMSIVTVKSGFAF